MNAINLFANKRISKKNVVDRRKEMNATNLFTHLFTHVFTHNSTNSNEKTKQKPNIKRPNSLFLFIFDCHLMHSEVEFVCF